MTHATIIAHGNGLAAFRRHVPLWRAFGVDSVMVLVPENDPIEQQESPWPVVRLGAAEHNGRESRTRLRWLLNYLAGLEGYSHYAVFEYDAFPLAPLARWQQGFCGNIGFDREGFYAPRYANPPWTLDYGSLVLMLRAARRWPDLYEAGEADRYLSALAWLAGVPVLPYAPPGFSRGWIDEQSITALRKAVYEGATMIHGVKQKWVLEAALQFYDERPREAKQ